MSQKFAIFPPSGAPLFTYEALFERNCQYERTVTLACANISKLIPRPGHGDMLRAWVYYEAKRSLNQKKCLSLVLFSLKTAF